VVTSSIAPPHVVVALEVRLDVDVFREGFVADLDLTLAGLLEAVRSVELVTTLVVRENEALNSVRPSSTLSRVRTSNRTPVASPRWSG